MQMYKTQGATRFSYHCSQNKHRQHNPKKNEEVAKHRDKLSMATFECDGWLHITVRDKEVEVEVKVQHKDDHIPYCVISLPEDVKSMIVARRRETVTQVRFVHLVYQK